MYKKKRKCHRCSIRTPNLPLQLLVLYLCTTGAVMSSCLYKKILFTLLKLNNKKYKNLILKNRTKMGDILYIEPCDWNIILNSIVRMSFLLACCETLSLFLCRNVNGYIWDYYLLNTQCKYFRRNFSTDIRVNNTKYFKISAGLATCTKQMYYRSFGGVKVKTEEGYWNTNKEISETYIVSRLLLAEFQKQCLWIIWKYKFVNYHSNLVT